ncbi:MAG TPA: PqqD family peptide modification chaperone [Gemmatimonadaceae bacterium]|nr:PqqD family peptide modification chaperone [Gemmatimonadaceae bacterium]
MIADASIAVVARNQVSSDLGGEAVILHLASGTYYSLNEVGATIWNLLQQPRRVRQILDHVVAEYDIDREECAADLHRLLDALSREGLIEIYHENAAA